MEILQSIKNYNLVHDVFGYRPSFHDAEIINIIGDRNTNNSSGPIFEMVIHVFEMTDKD